MTKTRTLMLVGILSAGGAVAGAPLDNGNGELHIYGSLTESPCRLDMSSAWQTVDMGNTPSSVLSHSGEKGHPVKVQFWLRDCQAVTTRNRNDRSDSLLWSHNQPGLSIWFSAPADLYNPQLFAIRGGSGFGLRITDEFGRDIRPNARGEPLLLTLGQDTLTYSLVIERTRAPLQAGRWYSLVNVGLEYD